MAVLLWGLAHSLLFWSAGGTIGGEARSSLVGCFLGLLSLSIELKKKARYIYSYIPGIYYVETRTRYLFLHVHNRMRCWLVGWLVEEM